MSVLLPIFAALIGYLLGSVNAAVLLTRTRYGRDVRGEGSGNAGATNVARVFGMRAGVLTLLCDALKTAVAAVIGQTITGDTGLYLALCACLVGHCFPLYFGFRGGKGVSVGAAAALMIDWRLFLILVCGFFLMFFFTKTVSACSIFAAALFPCGYFFLHRTWDVGMAVSLFIMALVIFLHRANIGRLLRGEEKRFHSGGEQK